ncbi:MAG: hypothetical protein AAB516_01055 [Patescibacteria group bacterium]
MSGYVNEAKKVKTKKRVKVFYEIIFPETPKGTMRDLRSLLKDTGSRMRRNSEGGITITPGDPCCPEVVSDLAFSIGESIPGLTVDIQTIPLVPAMTYRF